MKILKKCKYRNVIIDMRKREAQSIIFSSLERSQCAAEAAAATGTLVGVTL